MQATLRDLRDLDVVQQVGGLLRVVGERGVQYVSHPGPRPTLGFADVLLAGLAADGGLYVPESWPALPVDRARDRRTRAPRPRWRGRSSDEVDPRTARGDVRRGLRHVPPPGRVPPRRRSAPNHWLLELFHGPTLAFKDVALQLVGRLFDHVLHGGASAPHDRRRDHRGHRLGGDRGVP